MVDKPLGPVTRAEFDSMFGVNPPEEATRALLHAQFYTPDDLRAHLREIADRTKH